MAGRVLIVDDEKGMRLALKALLSKEGYEVETADSGEAAIRCIEQGSFHVVITVNRTKPSTIGTQPPWATLATLAPKNARSTIRNRISKAKEGRNPMRLRMTAKKRTDVTAIVPVTAMPYAAARPDEFRKPSTSAMHASASPMLTSGM